MAEEAAKPKKWKHISEIHDDGIRYLENRRDGLIKSIKTPWLKFNDAGIGGFEWGSITTIAGRPGAGKTLIAKEITTNAHSLNPDQDFAILDFQFEMTNKATAVREFSSVVNKSYKQLVSVDGIIDQSDLNVLKRYAAASKGKEIYQVDMTMTVEKMRICILEFLKEVGKPAIITIDHSVLMEKDASEKDLLETLNNLGKMLTGLKKRYPVIFIILTQMNRSIEDQSRKIPGTIGNFPTTADVFGADALLQHSDLMVIINKPSTYYIDVYGPQKFIMDQNTLALHFVKTRNGDNTLAFFEAEFAHMKIKEIPVPQTKKLKTQP